MESFCVALTNRIEEARMGDTFFADPDILCGPVAGRSVTLDGVLNLCKEIGHVKGFESLHYFLVVEEDCLYYVVGGSHRLQVVGGIIPVRRVPIKIINIQGLPHYIAGGVSVKEHAGIIVGKVQATESHPQPYSPVQDLILFKDVLTEFRLFESVQQQILEKNKIRNLRLGPEWKRILKFYENQVPKTIQIIDRAPTYVDKGRVLRGMVRFVDLQAKDFDTIYVAVLRNRIKLSVAQISTAARCEKRQFNAVVQYVLGQLSRGVGAGDQPPWKPFTRKTFQKVVFVDESEKKIAIEGAKLPNTSRDRLVPSGRPNKNMDTESEVGKRHRQDRNSTNSAEKPKASKRRRLEEEEEEEEDKVEATNKEEEEEKEEEKLIVGQSRLSEKLKESVSKPTKTQNQSTTKQGSDGKVYLKLGMKNPKESIHRYVERSESESYNEAEKQYRQPDPDIQHEAIKQEVAQPKLSEEHDVVSEEQKEQQNEQPKIEEQEQEQEQEQEPPQQQQQQQPEQEAEQKQPQQQQKEEQEQDGHQRQEEQKHHVQQPQKQQQQQKQQQDQDQEREKSKSCTEHHQEEAKIVRMRMRHAETGEGLRLLPGSKLVQKKSAWDQSMDLFIAANKLSEEGTIGRRLNSKSGSWAANSETGKQAIPDMKKVLPWKHVWVGIPGTTAKESLRQALIDIESILNNSIASIRSRMKASNESNLVVFRTCSKMRTALSSTWNNVKDLEQVSYDRIAAEVCQRYNNIPSDKNRLSQGMKLTDSGERLTVHIDRRSMDRLYTFGERDICDQAIELMAFMLFRPEIKSNQEVRFWSPVPLCQYFGGIPTSEKAKEVLQRVGPRQWETVLSNCMLLPVNRSNHWLLAVITGIERTDPACSETVLISPQLYIYLFDSLTMDDRDMEMIKLGLKLLLEEFIVLFSGGEYWDGEMIFINVAVPQQNGDRSCGFRTIWHSVIVSLCGARAMANPVVLVDGLQTCIGQYTFEDFMKECKHRLLLIRKEWELGLQHFSKLVDIPCKRVSLDTSEYFPTGISESSIHHIDKKEYVKTFLQVMGRPNKYCSALENSLRNNVNLVAANVLEGSHVAVAMLKVGHKLLDKLEKSM